MKLLEKKCSEQLELHLSKKKRTELQKQSWLYNSMDAFFAHHSLQGAQKL